MGFPSLVKDEQSVSYVFRDGSHTKMNTSINRQLKNINKRINSLQGSSKTRRRVSNGRSAPVANGATSGSREQRNVKNYHVQQTEKLGNVVANGSSDYSVVATSINPGVSFPWLANNAKVYDKYKFVSLTFRFKTAAPTLTYGNVGLGFDYNPLDASPANSQDFSQLTEWKIESVWKNFSLPIPLRNQIFPYLYIRSGLIGGVDLKTYDIGKLHIMFEGIPSNVTSGTVLGYIEAVYDIWLIDKQPVSTKSNPTQGLVSATVNLNTPYTSAGSSVSVANNSFVMPGLNPMTWSMVNNLELPVSGAAYNAYYYKVNTSINGLFTSSPNTANFLTISEPGLYNVSVDVGSNTLIGGLYNVTDNYFAIYKSNDKVQGTIVVEQPTTFALVFQNTTGSTITIPATAAGSTGPAGYIVKNLIINKL